MGQAASTRLLDLTTLELCGFPINEMPPYLAVSHVWSEGLFAPSYRDHIKDCEGMQMIESLLKQRPELSRLKHCWVDTWCINQDDAEDKARQIPLMSDIYKQAQIVAVFVKQSLPFSPAEWNLTMSNLREACHYYTSNATFNTPEARSCYNDPTVVENLTRAVGWIDQLAATPWFGRVWTAQEYILAQKLFWVGIDRTCVEISPESIHLVLQVWVEISHKSKEEWGNLSALNEIRAGYSHPTQAMRLARFRKCHIPEDEIYGLMAASKVAVTPVYGIGLDAAWKRWWEQAIMDGHIMWALLRTSSAAGGNPLGKDSNCIMPASGFRFRAFNRSGVFAGVRPYAPIELRNGTVSALARVVGVCKVDQYLGNFAEGAEPAAMIQDMVSTVCGNVETVKRICTAMCTGQYPETEISNYANWACDVYEKRVSGQPTQLQPYTKDLSLYRRSQLRYGKTYLGTIQNEFGSMDVLVNADQVPGGELLALDVGTNMEKDETYEETQGSIESEIFMVVHLPAGLDLGRDTLHKVGTTSTVFVPAFDKVRRAKRFNGIVLEDNFERYRIGGASCSYCHPVQTSDTPKPVARRRLTA